MTNLNDTVKNLRDLQQSPMILRQGRIDSVMWVRIEILALEAEALGMELERREEIRKAKARKGNLAQPRFKEQPEELDPWVRDRMKQALVIHGD